MSSGLFSTLPQGWTSSQEDAYLKMLAKGTKESMTTDLVRKNLLGDNGEKPSPQHQKAHITDCELAIVALQRTPGPIPSRQYFADIAAHLQHVDNWRWLLDYKNRPPKTGESYCNDYNVVQKLISGEKIYLTPHEASKVRKQVENLIADKDKLPHGYISSMAAILNNAYSEDSGEKLLDLRRLPEVKLPRPSPSARTITGLKSDGTPDKRTAKGKKLADEAPTETPTTPPPRPRGNVTSTPETPPPLRQPKKATASPGGINALATPPRPPSELTPRPPAEKVQTQLPSKALEKARCRQEAEAAEKDRRQQQEAAERAEKDRRRQQEAAERAERDRRQQQEAAEKDRRQQQEAAERAERDRRQQQEAAERDRRQQQEAAERDRRRQQEAAERAERDRRRQQEAAERARVFIPSYPSYQYFPSYSLGFSSGGYSSSSGGSTSGRAANPWNDYQHACKGLGMSRDEIRQSYYDSR